jgi:hypothetical protein
MAGATLRGITRRSSDVFHRTPVPLLESDRKEVVFLPEGRRFLPGQTARVTAFLTAERTTGLSPAMA